MQIRHFGKTETENVFLHGALILLQRCTNLLYGRYQRCLQHVWFQEPRNVRFIPQFPQNVGVLMLLHGVQGEPGKFVGGVERCHGCRHHAFRLFPDCGAAEQGNKRFQLRLAQAIQQFGKILGIVVDRRSLAEPDVFETCVLDSRKLLIGDFRRIDLYADRSRIAGMDAVFFPGLGMRNRQ